MSYATRDYRRRSPVQYLDPEAAIRKANSVIGEANAHVADILARSLEAIEIAERECQIEIARIKAEAQTVVEFWQQQAEDLGQALAEADARITGLERELAEARKQPKVKRSKKQRWRGLESE